MPPGAVVLCLLLWWPVAVLCFLCFGGSFVVSFLFVWLGVWPVPAWCVLSLSFGVLPQ